MSKFSTPEPIVSVIIPVFNDSERLAKCLEALEGQTFPKQSYEVIVVDNGSEDDVKDVVARFKQACIIYEDYPGSYAARNKGISVAKGDIFAFTDADCIPAADWIEKGVKALQSTPNCGLVAGHIELFFKNTTQPNAVEIYESIEYNFDQKRLVETAHFCQFANIFTSKKIVHDVGLFDGSLKSGGDREWGNRVFFAGYKQVYASDSCIYHPARNSFYELYKRVTRIEGGHHDLMKKKCSYSEQLNAFANDLMLAFTPPFRSFFRIWSNDRLTTPKQKIQFILAMLFVRYVTAWERIRLKLGGNSRRW